MSHKPVRIKLTLSNVYTPNDCYILLVTSLTGDQARFHFVCAFNDIDNFHPRVLTVISLSSLSICIRPTVSDSNSSVALLDVVCSSARSTDISDSCKRAPPCHSVQITSETTNHQPEATLSNTLCLIVQIAHMQLRFW